MASATNEILEPGTTIGVEGELGGIALDTCNCELIGERKVFVWKDPWILKSYAWTTVISEQRVELEDIGEFKFKALFHWVVDTPVHAAVDHPDWDNDVSIVFNLFNPTHALVTPITHNFRRGCFRYVYEVPDQLFASQVAWPVRNTSEISGILAFLQRVTGC
jgi:hypothetical protein